MMHLLMMVPVGMVVVRPAILCTPHCRVTSGIQMGLFDSFAAAFENDDTLGDRGDFKAKVSKLTWTGPKPEGLAAFTESQQISEQEAIEGQKLKDLAQAADIPIEYSCMKGTCGLCFVKVNGQEVAACTAVCPAEDAVIEYRDSKAAKAVMKEVAIAARAAKKSGKEFDPLAVTGQVAPTKAPTNPFGGGAFEPPSPFGGKPATAQAAQPETVAEPRKETLEERLLREMAEVETKKKSKGGWPFG